MLEIISSAQAQEAGSAAGGASVLSGVLPLILMLGVFYFLLIRPQQKKLKDHKNMVAALRRGDKIVTSGGIFGTIAKVNEEYVQVDIGKDVQIKLDKNSISVVLTRSEPADSKAKAKK